MTMKGSFFVIALSALFITSALAGSDGKCRALVMSGGGDKGSYQAAVLYTLMKELEPLET